MKKYSWIVALLLALSFTAFFTGCGVDPVEVEDEGGVLTTVFDLEDWMEGKAVGETDILKLFGDPAAVVNNNTMAAGSGGEHYMWDRANEPLSLSASVTRTPAVGNNENGAAPPGGAATAAVSTNFDVKIVKSTRAGGGKKGIEFAAKADSWVGLDLNYAYMKFKKGDTVKIGGTLIGPSTQFMLNTDVSDFRPLEKWGNSKLPIGTFEKTLTIGADDVVAIKGFKANYDAQVLRIKGNDAYVKFIIDTIVVTGIREAPFVPVTTIGGVPSVAAVGKQFTLSGTVYPLDATDKKIKWSLKDAGTTGITEDQVKAGKFTPTASNGGTLKVTATIEKGSQIIDPVTFEATYDPYEQDFTIMILGPATDISVKVGSGTTTITPVAKGSGGSILGGTADGKGYVHSSNYDTFFVVFQVDLGTGKTISDFTSIKFTLEGLSGDAFWKPTGIYVKDTNDIAAGNTGLENNGYENGVKIFTYAIGGASSFVQIQGGSSTAQKPYICLFVRGGTDAVYQVSDIEFVE